MNQTDPFFPPAAAGLPAGTLEAAEIGANRLDAWARTPHGRNFLAHALVQLARTGWLRTEPGEGFEPVQDRETPDPLPAASAVVAPPTDQAALRDRIAARLKRAPFRELSNDGKPNGPLLITAYVDDLADAVLAVLGEQADRAAVLTEAERTMLTYALDQAQERIWSEGGFTDEDQAAVDSLRRLAVEAHDTETRQQCPTSCDADCDAPCHEAHQPVWKRDHQPSGHDTGTQQPECAASISGNCLAEAQSERPCNTDDGECVHGGRPAADPQPVSDEFFEQLATAKVREDDGAGAQQQPGTEALTPRCDHCKQPGHSFEDCPRADEPALVAQQPAAEVPFVPPAHYRGRDGTAYCVHATPIGPNSCRECRDLADN